MFKRVGDYIVFGPTTPEERLQEQQRRAIERQARESRRLARAIEEQNRLKERELQGKTDPALTATDAGPTASPDFRSVTWQGETYPFTPLQAHAIELLWNAAPGDLGDAHIIEELGGGQRRLRDVFRNSRGGKKVDHPAWGKLIVAGATKGTHKLAALPRKTK